MLAVLCSVALDDLPLPVVSLDGERHAEDVVTRLDDLEDPPDSVSLLLGGLSRLQVLHQLVFHDGGAAVKEALHHPEEVGVVFFLRGVAVVPEPHYS